MHYLAPVDGNQEENNQPRVIRKQMEDAQIRRGNTVLFAPPVGALCSLGCTDGS